MKRKRLFAAIFPAVCVGWLAVSLAACGGDQKKKPANPKDTSREMPVAGANDQTAAAGEGTQGGATAAAAGDATDGVPAAPAPKPVGLLRQATSYVHRGQYEQAIATCRQALRRNEKYVPAMVLMARAYFHLGKTEFAEAMCLETALKINPNAGRCYNLLGHIALKANDRSLALKNFEKATQVEPGFGPAWLNYGALLIRVKNYDKAVTVMERATQLLGTRAQTHLNLGSAYRGAGKLMKARTAYHKALSLQPGYPAAYFNLGILYLDAQKVFDGKTRLQQLDEAVAYFNRYKQTGSYNRKEPVDEYIQQAHKLHAREKRAIEREKRRKAREAAKPKKKGGK